MNMRKFWKSECERVGDQVDKILYDSSKNLIQYIKDNGTLSVVFDDKNKTEKFYFHENDDDETGDLGPRLVTMSRNGKGVSAAEPIIYVLMPKSLYNIAESYRDDSPERYHTRKDLKIEYDNPEHKKLFFRKR